MCGGCLRQCLTTWSCAPPRPPVARVPGRGHPPHHSTTHLAVLLRCSGSARGQPSGAAGREGGGVRGAEVLNWDSVGVRDGGEVREDTAARLTNHPDVTKCKLYFLLEENYPWDL